MVLISFYWISSQWQYPLSVLVYLFPALAFPMQMRNNNDPKLHEIEFFKIEIHEMSYANFKLDLRPS